MPRDLSANMRAAANAEQTGEAVVTLLTFSAASWPDPIRVCDAGEDVESRSMVFTYFPFKLERPGDDGESPPTASLVVDNVDRRIVEAVRQLTGELTVTVETVLASDPDVVEEGPISVVMRNVEYDASTVRGDLFPEEDLLNEPCPADTYTPGRFPGLFAGGGGG